MAIPAIPLPSTHRLRSMSSDRIGEYDESYREPLPVFTQQRKAQMRAMLDRTLKKLKKKKKKEQK